MKLAFKTSLLFLATLIGVTPLFGDPCDEAFREFTKTIKKEYDISSEGTVHLSNKYGKMEVKTWDKNRVKIEVTIVVNAGSESQAQEVFDRISINFSNSQAYVKAETVIESATKSWWNWFNNSSTDYKINYLVYMPPSANLELYNRYGDAYIAELKNRALISVKYGNFKADGVGDKTTVNLAYGNGTLAKTGYLQSDLSYGNLTCNELRDADLTSKYSKTYIERAGVIRSTSKYDEYKIGTVREFRNSGGYDNFDIRSAENVVLSSKYSNANIGRLGNSIDFTVSYGGLVIGKVAKDFSGGINLVGKYSDFKITLEAGASARFEAVGSYTGITYPSGMSVSYEKEQGQSHEVKGHLGASGSKGYIKAQLSYGNIKLRQE